jgi:site-specific recombinase XerD
MNNRSQLHSKAYKNLLKGFDIMIHANGYRQTGRTYQNNVLEFLAFLESRSMISLEKIKASDMVTYYEHISSRPVQRGIGLLKSSTISGKMHSIDLFFNYLIEIKYLTYKIVLPRHTRASFTQRQVLTVQEVLKLYEACESFRDKVIIGLAYGCGLRRSEIENLDMSELLLAKSTLVVRNGKNSKRREIPLTNKILTDLKCFIYEERHRYLRYDSQLIDSVLINGRGKRMRGAQINQRLKDLVEKVNDPLLSSKEITLHTLRHSIATHLLEAGAGFDFVREFLGHREIDTVHIYARRRRISLLQSKVMNR